MNIIHLFRNLKYGGCQTLAVSIIKEMPQYKHHIFYLNPEGDDLLSMKTMFMEISEQVILVSQSDYSIRKINIIIDDYICSLESVIVVSWFYPFSLKLDLKCPVLHHSGMASIKPTRIQWWKNNIVFALSLFKKQKNHVVYASNHIKNTHKSSYFFNPHDYSIIYNGIDVGKYNNPSKKSESIRSIVMVGRLDRSKDFDSFINLAAVVKNLHPTLKFFIAGDGEDRCRLEMLNNNLGAPCSLLGNVRDIASFLSDADVMVFLNKPIEGFGNVIVEAMLSRVLVISNNIGASREIISQGKTGYLVNDFDELVLQLNNIISDSGENRERIIDNAHKDAMERFNSKSCANNYSKCIESLRESYYS